MDFAYCIIKSVSNGLAVDVRGKNRDPGAEVIVWREHGNANQIWYQDPATGTIRSKMNDFCLDVEDGKVVLNPFKSGDRNQQWKFHENKIRNRFDHGLVLEIQGPSEHGAYLKSGEFDENDTQLWHFHLVGGHAEHVRPQQFYIVSEMNDKVVDIEKGSEEEGVMVITWSRGNEKQPNQLWYCDSKGYIRSALNNMVFYSKESGKKLKTADYEESHRHHWKIAEGNKILNGSGECLDIRGRNHEDGAHLCSYRFKGHKNQLWRIEYE